MEQYGALRDADAQLYRYLNALSDKADKKYNSGLFRHESFLDALVVDDKVLRPIMHNLYAPKCPYEFSVFGIEILGNIYEQFLGKTIRLTAAHQAKVEEKPEVKKAGGVYYTPQYIVDYIVAHTVGQQVKGKSPAQIAKIRIVDPACGSGSFLLGAYRYLLEYHRNFYTKHSRDAALRDNAIYRRGDDDYALTIDTKRAILGNNIFGVDIDSQAVEVTKLSLLLRLMEGENQREHRLLSLPTATCNCYPTCRITSSVAIRLSAAIFTIIKRWRCSTTRRCARSMSSIGRPSLRG